MTPQQEWESLRARLDALREEVLLPGLDVRMRLVLAAAIGEPGRTNEHQGCLPPTGFYAVLNLHRPDEGDLCGVCSWTEEGIHVPWSSCPEVARVRAVVEAAS